MRFDHGSTVTDSTSTDDETKRLSPVESFIIDAHRQAPGMTSRAFARLRSSDGDTSYALLARQAEGLPRPRILDLACGDGFLLERVRDTAPDATLHGLDLSEAELSLARARLPSAKLIRGRAQRLPYDAGAFDLVLCHMAFMLLDDIPRVVEELGRVLSPGGALGIVVGARPPDGSPAFHYGRSLNAVFPALGETLPRFGDPRARTVTGMREVLSACFEVDAAGVVAVSRRVPLAEAWSSCEDMYNHARLGDDDRARIAEHLLGALTADADGQVVDVHAVLHLVARRSG